MEFYKKFITSNKHKTLKIAVLGDSIIDEYRYGKVTRVSPEFPVQVLTSPCDTGELCPGGAANVCHQMTNFNVDTYYIGFLDKFTKELCQKYKFNTDYCVDLPNGNVPKKIRFYDGDFPLLRWDIEKSNYGEEQDTCWQLRRKSFNNFVYLLGKIDFNAIILSDYNKGFWDSNLTNDIIRLAKKANIPTLVDPKRITSSWGGCTVFKPNANEAKQFSDMHNWERQAKDIKQNIGCKSVVITQGGGGVSGIIDDELFSYRPNNKLNPKEVNSVIGAGDCFIAVMAIAMGHGLSIEDSCKIAFEGGVQYVKAYHNKPITPQQIHSRFDPCGSKIISVEEFMKDGVSEYAFTNGCFDILHVGHLHTLQFAKTKGTKLIVGLNSDSSISALKGPERPINKYNERAAALASLEYVDYVIQFNEDTPIELIKKLKPDCIVKGGDYTTEEIVGNDIVKNIYIAPLLDGYSTTNLIKKIHNV